MKKHNFRILILVLTVLALCAAIHAQRYDGAPPLEIGQPVRLVPSHCDPTVNLHDWIVAVRRNRVEEIWPVTARGASR